MIRLFGRVQEHTVANMTKDQYLEIAMDVVGDGKLGDEGSYTVPDGGVVISRYDEFYVDKEALMSTLLGLFYREIEQDDRAENCRTRGAVKYCNIQHGIVLFIEYNYS